MITLYSHEKLTLENLHNEQHATTHECNAVQREVKTTLIVHALFYERYIARVNK